MEIYAKKKINIIGIEKELDLDTDDMIYIATRYKDYMEPFVPKSNGYIINGMYYGPGQLRENTLVYADKDTGYIEYRVPYSLYQYYGERQDGSHKVKNYTTPGTGKYWDNLMMTAVGKQFVEEIEDYIGGKLI